MDTEGKIMERKGWVAVLLGLIMPGMGQIYNGEALKGVCVFVIFIMTFVAGMGLAVPLPDRFLVAGAALATALVLAVYGFAAIDGCRKAQRVGAMYRGKGFNRWYVYLAVWMVESVVFMAGAVGYVRGNVVQAYKIVTSNMAPTVLQGDRILVDKSAYRRIPPKVGDIVVFVDPDDRSKVFIREIAGLPGDSVELASGRKEIVPHGQAYLLGTNAYSIDSRSFGFVPLRDLGGKARQIYWSSGANGIRWQRIGMTISGAGVDTTGTRK